MRYAIVGNGRMGRAIDEQVRKAGACSLVLGPLSTFRSVIRSSAADPRPVGDFYLQNAAIGGVGPNYVLSPADIQVVSAGGRGCPTNHDFHSSYGLDGHGLLSTSAWQDRYQIRGRCCGRFDAADHEVVVLRDPRSE